MNGARELCMVVLVASLGACSLGSITGADGGTSGSGEVKPSCYLNVGASSCTCYAANMDGSLSGNSNKKVAQCNEANVGGVSCTADVRVDGTTDQCSCELFAPACDDSGGTCYCKASSAQKDTRCTPSKYMWCCASDDSSQCYCGNGNFGSACGNNEHTVSTCSATDVIRASYAKTSCDGFKFATH
jgi:hypothetical protein